MVRAKPAATPGENETSGGVGVGVGVTGLFVGEVAQVRVWSSPCSEASLQRLVGRSGALEADATLVMLWKADEGTGDVLRNARPLQPPKPARGSKAVGAGGAGTGAEGHAELVGEWAWVPCFDPDDYESSTAAATVGRGSAAAAAPAVPGADLAGAVVGTPSSSSSAAQRSGRQGEEGFGGLAEGAETDLARSLGWRSVSTAGDEQEEEEEEEEEEDGVSASMREKRDRGSANSSRSASACAEAGANATAAGASAALAASAAIERADVAEVRRLPPRDALLGLLGKLFRQCSVYLAPCEGDPLVESTPPPRGVRVEARVQLQLVRREERALRAIVQPEVSTCSVCR